jgi:hypothetical protein
MMPASIALELIQESEAQGAFLASLHLGHHPGRQQVENPVSIPDPNDLGYQAVRAARVVTHRCEPSGIQMTHEEWTGLRTFIINSLRTLAPQEMLVSLFESSVARLGPITDMAPEVHAMVTGTF